MLKMAILFWKCYLRNTCHLVISKRHSIRQRVRFSSHSCLSGSDRTHGRRYIRQGLHRCLTFFCSFCTLYSGHFTCQGNGENAFLAASATRLLCNMHLSELALPHCTPLTHHLHRVKISALYLQRFRL